ncbi:RNA polymerase sigma factor [Singulisphaera sp. PoT]|uniref:RNA polymerase sigma factor n=1 Tax=Singulisphaera sp. PoT TaxID=3411797 RepID=UPI003BF4D4A9
MFRRERLRGGLLELKVLLGAGALGGLSDRELLEVHRSGEALRAELAFRLLVERHGPMVFALCRSVLRDIDDAEDAFQATFIVLARKSDSIRNREMVGPWLHGVASRVSRRARMLATRRRVRERLAVEARGFSEGDEAGPSPELEGILHEEIDRLPESLRAPLVLCCLQDQSYEAAAQRLGLSEPTLRGRLHRARKALKTRLSSRGLGASAIGLGASPGRFGPPSARLVDVCVRAALGHAGASGGSKTAAILVQGSLSAMMFSTYKAVAVCLLSASLALGTIVVAQTRAQKSNVAPEQFHPDPDAPPKSEVVSKDDIAKQAEVTTRAIQFRLNHPSELAYPVHMKLEDFLKAIKTQSKCPELPNGMPIYVDPEGLQEAGQTMTSMVNLDRKGVSIGEDLRCALRMLSMSYYVNSGMVMMSSRTAVLEIRLLMLEHKIDRVIEAGNIPVKP